MFSEVAGKKKGGGPQTSGRKETNGGTTEWERGGGSLK